MFAEHGILRKVPKMQKCEDCKYYQPVNAAGGICCLEYMQPNAKQAGVSSGHDDLVNADEDACRHFDDRKLKRRICRSCEHYKESAVYNLGWCKNVCADGVRMRVSGTDSCAEYKHKEGVVMYGDPLEGYDSRTAADQAGD